MDNTNKVEIENEKNLFREKETVQFKGKYFSTITREYHNADLDHKVVWECFLRNNQDKKLKVFGAEIIGITKEEKKRVLIIENFRYPIEKRCLEFPAGIIDPDEMVHVKEIYEKITKATNEEETKTLNQEFENNSQKAIIHGALREFKEETGYTGTFNKFLNLNGYSSVNVFKNLFHAPWISYENCGIALMDIDMETEENKNPKQNLEKDELIKVHFVELGNLMNFINEKMEKEDFGCNSQLYYFAVGMNFGSFIN